MDKELSQLEHIEKSEELSNDSEPIEANNLILESHNEKLVAEGGIELIDESQIGESSPPDEASIEVTNELEAKPSMLQEMVLQIDYQKEIDGLLTTRESLTAEAVLLSEQIKKQENSTEELQQWLSDQKRSFLWKVLSRMSNNKNEVQGRLDGYQDFINKLDVPKPGTLTAIRKRFHRQLLTNATIISVIGVLFIYLPKISDNYPEIESLLRFVNSDSYPTRWQTVFILLLLLFFILVSSLIKYYRDWSKFERRVTLSLWKLDEISKSVEHYRKEQARLNVLYPQVRDWLEILGNALHEPWNVDQNWLVNNLNEIPQDDFPFALRIAQAQEKDAASSTKIRRDAAERYLTRGWRSKVFEDQVVTAGELMGMSEDRLNVEILDADTALSPGGPRAIMREKIKSSELLRIVAKKQLIPLMKIVQTESIPESRPPVSENRTYILESLQPENSDLEFKTGIAWDDFLTISMGTSDKPRTPLSQLAFSESGRQVGHHDQAKTVFITPHRLISRVPNNETTFIDSYGESTRLPLDIVVRMDIVGPLPQEDVLILKRSNEEKEFARSNYERAIRDKAQDFKSGV